MIAEGLGHSHAGHAPLFQGLDLQLDAGSVTAVTGPSGSGKSTLLQLLAGWERPSSGRVLRPGIERIQWVFQNPHGAARRTALDHVSLPIMARGTPRRRADAEARELLGLFGLGEVPRHEFRRLSGGEAQRLMLARAIACKPDLLLVDEPTAQLDPVSAHTVNGSLLSLADRGTIVVVATHDSDTRHSCGFQVDLGDFR